MSKSDVYEAVTGEYQSKPLLTLYKVREDGSKTFVISFGQGKANAIVACEEEIKKFVGKNEEVSK